MNIRMHYVVGSYRVKKNNEEKTLFYRNTKNRLRLCSV